MNLPEVQASIGMEVEEKFGRKRLVVLEVERPKPHATAVMVRVREVGRTETYWISSTWLR